MAVLLIWQLVTTVLLAQGWISPAGVKGVLSTAEWMAASEIEINSSLSLLEKSYCLVNKVGSTVYAFDYASGYLGNWSSNANVTIQWALNNGAGVLVKAAAYGNVTLVLNNGNHLIIEKNATRISFSPAIGASCEVEDHNRGYTYYYDNGVLRGNLETATYIVDRLGSTFRMKNCTTGEIDLESSDAGSVINSGLGNLTDGQKLFLRNGIYPITNITAALGGGIGLASKSDITVEGESWGAVIEQYNLTTGCIGGTWEPLFEVSGCSRITIRNLQLIVNSTTTSGDALDFDGSSYCRVENCYVRAVSPSYDSGVTFHADYTNEYGNVVQDCLIDSHNIGINVFFNTGYWHVGHQFINNHIKFGDGKGITIRGANDSLVSGNTIEMVTSGAGFHAMTNINGLALSSNVFVSDIRLAGTAMEFSTNIYRMNAIGNIVNGFWKGIEFPTSGAYNSWVHNDLRNATNPISGFLTPYSVFKDNPGAPESPTFLMSFWGQGSTGQAGAINCTYLTPLYIPSAGTINEFSFLLLTGSPGKQIIASIYADNGKTPAGGSLLWSMNTSAELSWIALSLTVNVYVTQAQWIWVGLTTEDAIMQFGRPGGASFLQNSLHLMFDGCSFVITNFPTLPSTCPAVSRNAGARETVLLYFTPS
jgi:hypothetical protein